VKELIEKYECNSKEQSCNLFDEIKEEEEDEGDEDEDD
jgi:hypothetical protein